MDGERIARARVSPAVLAGGMVLIAINLRPAAASIGPVLNRIQVDNGLSSSWAGALATLPVLCFGLLAPLAPLLARRLGLHSSIGGAMFVLLVGMVVRLVPGVGFLFAGTAVAGAAIATGNVLVPVLVRRDFSERAGTAMAVYTTSLIGFAALSAGVTVPIADAFGGGWRPGLGVWAIPVAAAAVAWAPALLRPDRTRAAEATAGALAAGIDPVHEAGAHESRAHESRTQESRAHEARALLRRPLAWHVTLFFAVQSGIFYATLAWLPTIFRSHGASETRAGLLLSLTMAVGLITALTIPGLAARARDQRSLVVASVVLTAAGLLGIILAPMSAPFLWAVLLGLGQNASFPLALMLIVLRGGSVAATEGLSTLAQSVGYVLAAIAPLAVGAVHGLTSSWTPPLILMLALGAPMLAAGLAAARDRQLAP